MKAVFIFMENIEKKKLIKEIASLLNYLVIDVISIKEIRALTTKRKIILTDKEIIEKHYTEIIKKFNDIYCFLDYSESIEEKEKVTYERDLIKIDTLRKYLK